MKKIGAWLLCALWMGVIFMMSAMPGDASEQQSGRVVAIVMRVTQALFGEAAESLPPDAVSFVVRKLAHMAEYAVLFWLYRWALALSGVKRPGWTALALCALYACTDEVHQGFVADRMPSAVDVMIDSAGACAAWGTYTVWKRIFENRTMENQSCAP